MSGGAPELLAAIVSANVSELAATTNRIEAYLREQVVELAETIELIDSALQDAMVIDRITARRLSALDGRILSALRILEREREES